MRTSVLSLLLSVVLVVCAVAADDVATYKAEFMVKLMDYVTWPDGADTGTDGSFTIGVFSDSEMAGLLKTEASNKGGNIVIKELTLDDDFSGCQIVYIGSSDLAQLPKCLKKVAGKPILTVSHAENFAGFGVMVNFTDGDSKKKVNFEANRLAAMDAGLKISAQLLKLGKVI